MSQHLPPNWEHRLLAVLGAPATFENLRLLTAWSKAEGGTAQFNPLNTTYPLPWGSTNYNNTTVKNYARATAGVCATALTLIDSRYSGILGSLQGGSLSAEEIVTRHQDAFKLWGTNPQTILAVLGN